MVNRIGKSMTSSSGITDDSQSTHFLMLTMVEVIDDRFYEDAAGLLSFEESILFDAKKRTTMR